MSYCTVDNVLDLVGSTNVPSSVTGSMVAVWISGADAWVDNATDSSWTGGDTEPLIREASSTRAAYKLTKRVSMDSAVATDYWVRSLKITKSKSAGSLAALANMYKDDAKELVQDINELSAMDFAFSKVWG